MKIVFGSLVAAIMVATLLRSIAAWASTVDSRLNRTCPTAFGALVEILDAHESNPHPGVTERDLSTLAQWTADLNQSAGTAFLRFENLRALENEIMLTLNNRELARLAVLTAPYSYAEVENYLKTLLVQLRVRNGTRALKVPHRIHARLTAVALLTNETPGGIALEYGERFARVIQNENALRGESEVASVILAPPYDLALQLLIAESAISKTFAGRVLQE